MTAVFRLLHQSRESTAHSAREMDEGRRPRALFIKLGIELPGTGRPLWGASGEEGIVALKTPTHSSQTNGPTLTSTMFLTP